MKNIKFILALFALGYSLSGIAQRDIVIIDKGNGAERAVFKKEPRLNDNTKVVKFSPLQIIVGEINLGFELQTSLKGSAEFSAGPTISNIGLGGQSHLIDPWSGSQSETTGLGFFASAAYRYYPLDGTEALNRFYVSPVLKYRLYNFGLNDLANGLDPTKGNESQLNFLFNFGYQLWVSKSFSLDFFGGMGIGMQTVNSSFSEAIYNPDTFDYDYRWRESSITRARYVFTMGLKVGIGSK
ncbi:MAG: DUF3575 domain-containing protein [Crocinitomicaceae bacterium]|nr:DUF3575 domain-containing protein [Crocinitomicaceae bacterium]MDG1657891.1 DUF3575 domain-containing protein [Crocinitomicaceae bacterium]MDG2440210.1 DUF3575 domain-containing protein [Crocinitomicaceae bacterium]|tara:strand:- start:4591 stop:5310 length:720 start_codon:yes stop_codon:yes gene_type:complete